MNLTGQESELLNTILKMSPTAKIALIRSSHIKGQLRLYQAAALYTLAKPFNGKPMLEIGTLHGYSASLLAQACPVSKITTLNPAANEVRVAKDNLILYPNVEVIRERSWDYLKEYSGPKFGLIFVDGDHRQVARDLPWWNHLEIGGLMLFHDYTPHNAPPVCSAVYNMMATFGRAPDVKIIDDNNVGMAGFYKQDGEILSESRER